MEDCEKSMNNHNIKEIKWKNKEQELLSKNRHMTKYAMRVLEDVLYMISLCGLPIKLSFELDFENEKIDDFI